MSRLLKDWTPKDALSVVISVTALAVSATAFYRSNFYVNETVSVRTIVKSITYIIEDPSKFFDMPVSLVFVNNGNRDAMVVDLDVWALEDPEDIESASQGFGDGEAGAPFVLKPGEIKLVTVKLDSVLVIGSAGKYLALDIDSINSSGEIFLRRIRFARSSISKNPDNHDVVTVLVERVNEPVFRSDFAPLPGR